jgi:hypothetical protein
MKARRAAITRPLRIYAPALLLSLDACSSNASDISGPSEYCLCLTALRAIKFLALLCGLSLVGEAKADIYLYQDSQGVIHFSNVPIPPGHQAIIRDWSYDGPAPSLARNQFEENIRAASDRYGVDPRLVRAVIRVESDFNFQARSHRGGSGFDATHARDGPFV